MHLVVAASRDLDRPWPVDVLQRVSAISMMAVMGLAASGIGLALFYIDGARALLGTAFHESLEVDGAVFAGEVDVSLLRALESAERRVLPHLPAGVAA